MLLAGSTRAQEKKYNWQHHAVFTMGFDAPDFFVQGAPDQYNTVAFANSIDTAISLSFECLIPNSKFTPSDLDAYRGDDYHYFDTVTYDFIRDEHFILSGWSTDGRILYIKGLKKGTCYYEMDLSYPAKYRNVMDKVLPKMAASLH